MGTLLSSQFSLAFWGPQKGCDNDTFHDVFPTSGYLGIPKHCKTREKAQNDKSSLFHTPTCISFSESTTYKPLGPLPVPWGTEGLWAKPGKGAKVLLQQGNSGLKELSSLHCSCLHILRPGHYRILFLVSVGKLHPYPQSGPEKEVIAKGGFPLETSLESLKSRDSIDTEITVKLIPPTYLFAFAFAFQRLSIPINIFAGQPI